MMTKWYENIARIHNIPLIMVDIPFSNTVDTPEEKSRLLNWSIRSMQSNN